MTKVTLEITFDLHQGNLCLSCQFFSVSDDGDCYCYLFKEDVKEGKCEKCLKLLLDQKLDDLIRK
jgi:hypothetical protein